MMLIQTDLFKRCIEVVLVNEGGFQNNPNDLGNWTGPNRTGELKGTKYGIAARFFPYLDIKNLTMAQARQIYYTKYWLPMELDGIINELAVLQMFDFGVNAGKGRAIRTAQNIVGVIADGYCGRITKEAINKYEYGFVNAYVNVRILYYRTIAERDPKNKIFLNGWINRVVNTHFDHYQ